MKKHLFILSVLLLQAVYVSVYGQERIVSGDTIRGVVFDSEGPMWMVSIYERDSKNNIVAQGVTDSEGKFSFSLVNPKDRLWLTYEGYDTVDIPISKHEFQIKLQDSEALYPVYILDGGSDGSKPIPLRKAAKSVDTINMSEFEHLGIPYKGQ